VPSRLENSYTVGVFLVNFIGHFLIQDEREIIHLVALSGQTGLWPQGLKLPPVRMKSLKGLGVSTLLTMEGA
jgi:hypothetical protein